MSLAQAKDPQGRLDVMAARTIEEYARRSSNPMLEVLHKQFQPEIEKVLKRHLGPRTPHAKRIKKLVADTQEVLKRRATAQ
jgi:hypothetical protein